MRYSKSPMVLLILLKTGSRDSALGDKGEGVRGASCGGLGVCLVPARMPKSWPKAKGEDMAGVCCCSSLKKLAIELVGDWLRLEDGEIESAVLPRLKVGLRLRGLGLGPTM